MGHIYLILKFGLCKKSIREMIFILLLSIISVGCLVLMNRVYGWFYDGLVARDYNTALIQLILYFIAMVSLGISEAEMHYRKRIFTVNCRQTLYNYYGVYTLDEEKCLFSCQRMSQDLFQFSFQFINLFSLLLHSILLIPAFLYVLLSSSLDYYIILICIILTVICSMISKKIGKPVAKLQYNQESLEGSLRRKLIEQIKVPKDEQILPDLLASTKNYIAMSRKERWLMYFKNSYEKISHCLPYICVLPKYMAKEISLGQMVQTGVALAKLITEISFIVNNIDKIVEFDATIKRVKELEYARHSSIQDILNN